MSSETLYDLCIVGAGMFGSAAARYASMDSSLKICMIGPNEPSVENISEREIFGAHYDEGRIVRYLDENPTRVALSNYSIKRFKDLEKLSGIDFYNPVGYIAIGQKDGALLQHIKQAAKETQAPITEISSSDKLQERYPFLLLKEDESALLDDDGAGFISPRNLVSLQKQMAERQGCVVLDSVVDEIKTSPEGFQEIYTDTESCIKAKRVLICTGAFMNLKPRMSMKPLALQRHKETAVLLHVPDEEVHRLRLMPTIIRHRSDSTFEIEAYILPPIKYPDGKYYLKFGKCNNGEGEGVNTLNEMKEWYTSSGHTTVTDTNLINFVNELIPGLKVIGMKTMQCILSFSKTGLPYIDQISPSITVAVAGNGRGAKFSDEVGRIAAHLSLTGKWDSNLDQDHFRAVFE